MSQDPQKNMEALRHLFNTLNEYDTATFLNEVKEILTEDYILHDPGNPAPISTRAVFIEGFKQNSKVRTNRRVTVEDMFGAEDKVVSRMVYEYTDLQANEHKKIETIVISRFEGGKIAEEWQVTAPIPVPAK